MTWEIAQKSDGQKGIQQGVQQEVQQGVQQGVPQEYVGKAGPPPPPIKSKGPCDSLWLEFRVN